MCVDVFQMSQESTPPPPPPPPPPPRPPSRDGLCEHEHLYFLRVTLPFHLALVWLQDEKMGEDIVHTFGVKLRGTTPAACDDVAFLVKMYRTTDAYCTFGDVTDEESWAVPREAASNTLFKAKGKWKVYDSYDKILRSVARRYDMSLLNVTLLDQSMRMKRIRSNTSGCPEQFNIRCEDKYLILMIPDIGDSLGMWFDIALSNDVPDKGLMSNENREFYAAHRVNMVAAFSGNHPRVPRRCAQCNARETPTNKHHGQSNPLVLCNTHTHTHTLTLYTIHSLRTLSKCLVLWPGVPKTTLEESSQSQLYRTE
jgi:hypothetical protein